MAAFIAESLNLGDLLKYEAPNLYSRDRVSVAPGQNLPLGAVVGMVTATGQIKQVDPSAADGTQVAAGVLLQACEAPSAAPGDSVAGGLADDLTGGPTGGPTVGLIVSRHAIVAQHALAWPEAITTAEQRSAIAQLKALGVLVRQGA